MCPVLEFANGFASSVMFDDEADEELVEGSRMSLLVLGIVAVRLWFPGRRMQQPRLVLRGSGRRSTRH